MNPAPPDNEESLVDRTEAAARNALLISWARTVTDADEDDVGFRAVTEDLVVEILQVAWRHQFEDDRAAARREVRGLVRDRVEEALLEEDE